MKKILLHLIPILLIPVLLTAQPVLHHCESYAIGTFTKFYKCDGAGISPGDSGANKTWDFSTLQVKDSFSAKIKPIPQYSPLSVATYVSETDNLFLASQQYSYYYIDTGGIISLIGSGSGYINDISENYQDPKLIMKNPITYNDDFTDSSLAIDSNSSEKDSLTEFNTIHADAYGTLTTPMGIFPNCLRITTLSRARYYFYYLYNNTLETDIYNFRSISWYDDKHSAPLLTIEEGNKPPDTKYVVIDVKYLQQEAMNNHDTSKLVAYYASIGDNIVYVECNFKVYQNYHAILYNFNGQKIYDTHFTPGDNLVQLPMKYRLPYPFYILVIASDKNPSERTTIKVRNHY